LNTGVEAVLLHALRKSPLERFSTGREMLMALERALANELGRPEASQPMPAPTDQTVARTLKSGIPASYERASAPPPSNAFPPPPVYAANAAPAGQQSQSVPWGQPQAGERSGSPPGRPVMGGYAQPKPRRRGFSGFGCLALMLATIALAGALGAAIAFSGPGGFNLPALFPGIPVAQQPTPTATATEEPPPIEIPTETPTETPEPTFTPEPTATETPTPTPSPTEPAPTDIPATPTLTLTFTPTPTPQPDLLIVRFQRQGLILVNQGLLPLPLEPLELWDEDDDEEELLGNEFEWEILEPGQCLAVWERNSRPRLPDDLKCEPVGKPALRQGGERFWLRDMHVYYDQEMLAECPLAEERCEIVIWK
jgi:hypothetical protein